MMAILERFSFRAHARIAYIIGMAYMLRGAGKGGVGYLSMG